MRWGGAGLQSSVVSLKCLEDEKAESPPQNFRPSEPTCSLLAYYGSIYVVYTTLYIQQELKELTSNRGSFLAGLFLVDGRLLSCTGRRAWGQDFLFMKGIQMQLGAMPLVYFLSSFLPAVDWLGIDECSFPFLTGHSTNMVSPLNSTQLLLWFFFFSSFSPLIWLISLMPLSTSSVPSACCMLLRATTTTTRIMKWMSLIRAEQLWPTGERSSAHSLHAAPPPTLPHCPQAHGGAHVCFQSLMTPIIMHVDTST